MKNYILISLLLTATISCQGYPGKIPSGSWNYTLIVNGSKVGSAKVSSEIKNSNYISTSEMEMNAGDVTNTTRQIVTETLHFKPVKLEIYNKVITEGNVNEVNTVAEFSGKKITLNTGQSKSIITIKKQFVLGGNYLMNELIKKRFKKGTVLKAYIYEPTIEIDVPILSIIKVIGRESISINGKVKSLIHIGYSVENMKNIDIYIDDEGIQQKMVVTMLNNRLELVIK